MSWFCCLFRLQICPKLIIINRVLGFIERMVNVDCVIVVACAALCVSGWRAVGVVFFQFDILYQTRFLFQILV